MLSFVLWAVVAQADVISVPKRCGACAEGQEERTCDRDDGTACADLERDGWQHLCTDRRGDERWCQAPRASSTKFIPPPAKDGETDAAEAPPIAEVAAATPVAAEAPVAAEVVPEASGCGCATATWSPGVGLLLLIASGARRRAPRSSERA